MAEPYHPEVAPGLQGRGLADPENQAEKPEGPPPPPTPEDVAKQERMRRARELAANENRSLEEVLAEAEAAERKVGATVQERLGSERELAAMENRLPGESAPAPNPEMSLPGKGTIPSSAQPSPHRSVPKRPESAPVVVAAPNPKISLSRKETFESPAQDSSRRSPLELSESAPVVAAAPEEMSEPQHGKIAARSKFRMSWRPPLRLAFSPAKLALFLGVFVILGSGNALYTTHRMKNTARVHFQHYATTYQQSRPSLLLSQYYRTEGKREAILEEMVELNIQFGEWYHGLPYGKQKQVMAVMYESFRLLNQLIAMELAPDLFTAEDLNSRSRLRLRLRELERQALATNTQMEQWDRENQQLREDFWYGFFHPLSAC